jgi:tetratricopeptide (TPR) repeat protein
VAFELGVLLTREEDFRGAAEAYDRALALRLDTGSRSTLLANLAEVTMMSEDLERARSLYEQAVLEGSREERVLALWGLAVALDRSGEAGESMERAKQALREDQRPMGVLKQSRVFFVPPHEAHYYDGIGYRALAEQEAGEDLRVEHVLGDYRRVLERPLAPAMQQLLKQHFARLEEELPAGKLAGLTEAVKRALARTPSLAPGAQANKSPREDTLSARQVRIVLLGLQSLRAFVDYLARGGEQGPWALDARAHVDELLGWFAAGSAKPH